MFKVFSMKIIVSSIIQIPYHCTLQNVWKNIIGRVHSHLLVYYGTLFPLVMIFRKRTVITKSVWLRCQTAFFFWASLSKVNKHSNILSNCMVFIRSQHLRVSGSKNGKRSNYKIKNKTTCNFCGFFILNNKAILYRVF